MEVQLRLPVASVALEVQAQGETEPTEELASTANCVVLLCEDQGTIKLAEVKLQQAPTRDRPA